tara:strand:- start:686 stop:958 length:273 start_codon:yes stop_codon:yes gene_type:complete
MPTTFLNTQQALELADALDHAVDICKKEKTDASVISFTTDHWVATPTNKTEWFDQTLVRVCYNESDSSTKKHTWGYIYKNSVTGELKVIK